MIFLNDLAYFYHFMHEKCKKDFPLLSPKMEWNCIRSQNKISISVWCNPLILNGHKNSLSILNLINFKGKRFDWMSDLPFWLYIEFIRTIVFNFNAKPSDVYKQNELWFSIVLNSKTWKFPFNKIFCHTEKKTKNSIAKKQKKLFQWSGRLTVKFIERYLLSIVLKNIQPIGIHVMWCNALI